LRAFCSSALWQICISPEDAGMQTSISSGCRNYIALHGGWDTHSRPNIRVNKSEVMLESDPTLADSLLETPHNLLEEPGNDNSHPA
jgi:hypothetical protein